MEKLHESPIAKHVVLHFGMNMQDMRKDYTQGSLDVGQVERDPLLQFERWFTDAKAAGLIEPNAMTLATCDAQGSPQARVVLLKGLDERGFSFFTNYQSHKGKQLAHCAKAALVFYWDKLERQVRITGKVEQVSVAESEDYFRVRPRKSQLAAWVSQQSSTVQNREALEQAMAEVEKRFEGQEVSRPPWWGGYRVLPQVIEFWQGRRSRLHDRLVYQKRTDGSWGIVRFAP